jgi:hypothetical protein
VVFSVPPLLATCSSYFRLSPPPLLHFPIETATKHRLTKIWAGSTEALLLHGTFKTMYQKVQAPLFMLKNYPSLTLSMLLLPS